MFVDIEEIHHDKKCIMMHYLSIYNVIHKMHNDALFVTVGKEDACLEMHGLK